MESGRVRCPMMLLDAPATAEMEEAAVFRGMQPAWPDRCRSVRVQRMLSRDFSSSRTDSAEWVACPHRLEGRPSIIAGGPESARCPLERSPSCAASVQLGQPGASGISGFETRCHAGLIWHRGPGFRQTFPQCASRHRFAENALSVLEARGHARTPDCGNSLITATASWSGRPRFPGGEPAGATVSSLHDESGSRLC